MKPLFQQKKLKKNRDVDSNGTRPLFDKYKSKYGNYSILKAYELGQRGAKSSMNYVYTEKENRFHPHLQFIALKRRLQKW